MDHQGLLFFDWSKLSPFSEDLPQFSETAQLLLKIVENLEIPTDDPKYIEKFCDERLWGPSVLFIDEWVNE